jgi:RPA family protein
MGDAKKRQTAYKVRIAELLNAKYVKEEGWLPNYVKTGNLQVSRVNLVAAVISAGEEIVIDDGSGSITIRSFDSKPLDFDVGDVVLIIGRVREYGSQKYVTPEIIKKVDDKVAKLRLLELEKQNLSEPKKTVAVIEEKERKAAETITEESVEEEELEGKPKKIYELIKNLDFGEGADFDEVISKVGDDEDETEKGIDFLLKKGEIFELRPGKLKVME